jgi:hypothetical protein
MTELEVETKVKIIRMYTCIQKVSHTALNLLLKQIQISTI